VGNIYLYWARSRILADFGDGLEAGSDGFCVSSHFQVSAPYEIIFLQRYP